MAHCARPGHWRNSASDGVRRQSSALAPSTLGTDSPAPALCCAGSRIPYPGSGWNVYLAALEPASCARPLAGSIRLLLPVSVCGCRSKLCIVDFPGVCGCCALESEASSRYSLWVGCCIACTNQLVRIHDRWRNCLRVCLGMRSGTSAKPRPSRTQIFQTSVAACSRPDFRGNCQVSRQAISRLQFQGGDPTCKREPRSASIARGLGGLPELSTALGLNITWGLSLLLIFTVWAIAIKKRMIALSLIALIATLLLAYQMSTGNFTFFGIGGAAVLLILVLSWFFAVKQLACALPFIFTVLAMGWVWSKPWHYGMALTAFLVSVWGAWPAGRSPNLNLQHGCWQSRWLCCWFCSCH